MFPRDSYGRLDSPIRKHTPSFPRFSHTQNVTPRIHYHFIGDNVCHFLFSNYDRTLKEVEVDFAAES